MMCNCNQNQADETLKSLWARIQADRAQHAAVEANTELALKTLAPVLNLLKLAMDEEDGEKYQQLVHVAHQSAQSAWELLQR